MIGLRQLRKYDSLLSGYQFKYNSNRILLDIVYCKTKLIG